jgi:hypothetical protein
MVDNVTDIELGTLTSGGWDTSAAPVASQPNVYQSTSDPTVNADTTIGVRRGDVWINTATGNEFRCISNADGAARWRFYPRVLGQGGGLSHTGDTNETKLVGVQVPAGAMGTHGLLHISPNTWSNNNSGNAKTRRIRFGAADDLTGTVVHQVAPTTNTLHSMIQAIKNDGSASAQVCMTDPTTAGPYGAYATTITAPTIDTSAASYVVFSGQLANGGDNIQLELYSVTLTRPDIGP